MDPFDEPQKVAEHQNRFTGGKALVVLGGLSGRDWQTLRDEIQPDAIISCSGATRIHGAEYWIEGENMNRAFYYARKGEPRYQEFMHVYEDENPARYKLINFQNWIASPRGSLPSVAEHYRFDEQPNIVKINRIGLDDAAHFSLREYGEGLLYGWKFKKLEELGCRIAWRVGTVALHAVHWAGILGCREVHTIGYDLCFQHGRKQSHHWYRHPGYIVDSFRTEKVFTHQYGIDTQWDWIEAAEFVESIQWLFARDGLRWVDHSHGLLSRMGVWCAETSHAR